MKFHYFSASVVGTISLMCAAISAADTVDSCANCSEDEYRIRATLHAYSPGQSNVLIIDPDRRLATAYTVTRFIDSTAKLVESNAYVIDTSQLQIDQANNAFSDNDRWLSFSNKAVEESEGLINIDYPAAERYLQNPGRAEMQILNAFLRAWDPAGSPGPLAENPTNKEYGARAELLSRTLSDHGNTVALRTRDDSVVVVELSRRLGLGGNIKTTVDLSVKELRTDDGKPIPLKR